MRSPGSWRDAAICAALAVATVVAYAAVGQNGFIDYDDNDYVTDNPRVQAGPTWDGLAWALTTGHSSNWHPLTWLSHMVDCRLFGLAPAGHHLVSLALHTATSVLLFLVWRRMTGARWASAFVAAVFALHPLHVQSVAWVAERKDVLSGLFWVLAMLAYARWVERPGPGRRATLLVVYALGLMAKPMLVTLPFVLLLLDYWPLGRMRTATGEIDWRQLPRLVRDKLPLLALALMSSVTTYLVQQKTEAMDAFNPLSLRAANAVCSYVAYLGETVWPVQLALFRPFPTEIPVWQTAGATVLLAAATFWVLRSRCRHPYLAVGWAWYLGTLVPVIGLVQVGEQARADRYMYLPLIGVAVAVAFAARAAVQRWPGLRRPLAGLGVLAMAACAVKTFDQVRLWKDDKTLFTHDAQVVARNHIAHGILGRLYLRERRLEEAERELRQAVAFKPAYAVGHNNLGSALQFAGRFDEALAAYREALRWRPSLGKTHHNVGLLLLRRGDVDEAVPHFEEAIRLQPDWASPRQALQQALALRAQKAR